MNRYISNLAGTLLSSLRINNATIDSSGLTAARTVTLPDKAGTVAMTSDIPSLPLSLANGGTGGTTQSTAANGVLPSQTIYANSFLATNGSTVEWRDVSFGWYQLPALTYETADSPIFQFSISGNYSDVITVGMRIKLTQTTTKYFIVVAVGAYSGGKTIITVYGGTDYTLTNATIDNPYFSCHKAPRGFDSNPDKWAVSYSYSSAHVSRTNAQGIVQGTWYNVLQPSDLPIGCWNIEFFVGAFWVVNQSGATNAMSIYVTLSNSTSAESYQRLTSRIQENQEPAGSAFVASTFTKHTVSIASKQSMYILVKTTQTVACDLTVAAASSPVIIKYVCAYL
jgi:hypothetical protein